MKANWKILTYSVITFAAVMLSACDPKNSGVQSQYPNATCTNGQCYNYYGTPYQYPASSQIQFTARKMDNNYNSYGYYQLGSLQLQSGFRSLLKEAMGVCDRNDISGGQAACDSWMNGTAEIAFQMDNATSSGVRLMIKATPQQNFWNYYYSMPNIGDFLLGWATGINLANPQGFFNPMVLNSTIWPVNNSQGFEIRANGPTASWAFAKLLQFQVATGKVEDNQFNFQLYYNGILAASGTMQKCTINGYNYCTYL